VPTELQRDPMTHAGSPQGQRDRARTPMRWNAAPGGGFTGPTVTPWLPIGPAAVNVADQRDEPDSVLSMCRRLVELRHVELGPGAGSDGVGSDSAGSHSVGSHSVAGYRRLASPPGVWSYAAGPLRVTANLGATPAAMPDQAGEILLRTGPAAAGLGPWEGVVARASAV
jgi:oligo-1,6-glucosidase